MKRVLLKRVLLKSALALCAIALAALLVVAGALFWAVRSESGMQFVWQRVAPLLPPGLSVATVEGRLLGPLAFGGVVVQTATLELRVERVDVRWNAWALLDRTVDVEQLGLRGVDIVRLPAEPTAPSEPNRLPESIDLPVDVRIAGASVDTLRFRASPNAEPLSIERASFAGGVDAERMELRELAVSGPLFDVSGELNVVPRGAYATSGRLEWIVRPGEYPDAHGSTRFSGDLAALAIEQRVDAPYDAHIDLNVEEPLTALRFDGEVAFTVQPAAFGIEQVPAETIGSTLALRGTLEALEMTGRVELTGGEADGVAADISARYAGGDTAEIRALDLVDLGSRAAVHASGRVAFGAEQPVLELDATWTELQWPLRGAPQVASDSGSLELHGTMRDYTVALRGNLALADGTNGKVSVSGTGNAETLDLDRVDVEALRGRIAGRTNLRWAPSLSAAIEVTGTDLDPGVVLREWPGQVGARVRADAWIEGENVTVALHELTAEGRLRDRPLELRARGAYATDTLRIDAFTLRSGSTDASASGTAGRELALEWQLQSPNLGELWPQFGGRLSASGELRGPRERPRVEVEASGQVLHFMGSEVDEIELDADIDVSGQAHSTFALNVSAAEVEGVAIPQLEFTGEGNAARHTLALAATTSVGDASLSLTGTVADPWTRGYDWTFALDEATLAYPKLAPWALREPATGRVARTEAELARSCWQSGAAELCVEGTRGPQSTHAQLVLSELAFDYFAALLGTPAQIDGNLSLEGTFEQLGQDMPQLDISLRTSPGRLVSGDVDDAAGSGAAEPYALAFGPADGRVTMKDDRVEGSLRVPFAELGEIEASARIAPGAGAPFGQRVLNGHLLLDIAALDFVSELVPQVQNTQGAVTGDLLVAGTVGKPQLAGSLALVHARATLPGINVELEGVELELAGDGESGLTVNAQARSGGGTVSAEGRVMPTTSGPEGRIAIDGDAFEVIDTADAQIVVSPDLDLALTPEGAQLTGQVLVPSARLTPRDTGEEAVAASGDQVIVEPGDEGEARATRPTSATVRLVLGDDVRIDGYGLTGRLGGAIEITEKPGEPTVATGELRVVEGVYEAYGQQLEIEAGRVVFAGGPITEPGVDIRAVRRPAEGIVVGARVRGRLAAPELSLFSEPQMAQQEQLSYLVLGRPLDDASAAESSAMSRAALALAVSGGNFVSERINKNLGLDSFGIETDPNEAAAEASFVIGKYLTPSLYVSYGIGLFEPVNTVKLRYSFAKRWRLETESSSEASGGDLIYNIERGQ